MKVKPKLLENEKGILENNGIFFHDPTKFATDHLFYPLFGATYTVTAPYRVTRGNSEIHWPLFLSVLDGTLYIDTEYGLEAARNDEIIFIDTAKRHSYYANEKTTFQWLYFDGPMVSLYYNLLTKNGVVYKKQSQSALILNNILRQIQTEAVNEHRVSSYLYDVLTRLTKSQAETPSPVKEAVKYMEYHYFENLSLEKIAGYVSLHPVYFSRIFKNAIGDSPHSYLIRIRLRHAKILLMNSNQTVEQISVHCGFQSSKHFIRAFKQRNLVTPQMFRKYFTITGFKD